jgi:regulator of protease activity HflC (stomatin/prohibitin superfamily)
MIILGFAVGLAAFALFLAKHCWSRVEQGHLAALTSFGAAVRDGERIKTLGPGLHWKLPWQEAVVVRMMEQNLVLSGEKGGTTAMAQDGTVLRFDSILRLVPVEKALEHFLFDLRAPIEHITGLFTCLLRNEIANFKTPDGRTLDEEAGSYALIRKERKRLNRQIEEFCQKEIGRRYGVQFNAVDLADILPPDELAEALNAVMNAQNEALHRAEAECQQRVVAAERGVEIAAARARAVELEIAELSLVLHDLHRRGTLPLYVTRRRAEVLSQSRALFLGSAS